MNEEFWLKLQVMAMVWRAIMITVIVIMMLWFGYMKMPEIFTAIEQLTEAVQMR